MPAILIPAGQIVSPLVPQLDLAVAPNFERFDGLDVPATNPAGAADTDTVGTGAVYGFDAPGAYPRPGQMNTPVSDQTYTAGPLKGVVGTVGGQPLSAASTSDRLRRPPGDYSPGKTHSIQFRLGVGQHGPSELGAAQTTQLSEITGNPPVPGDLSGIIAGIG